MHSALEIVNNMLEIANKTYHHYLRSIKSELEELKRKYRVGVVVDTTLELSTIVECMHQLRSFLGVVRACDYFKYPKRDTPWRDRKNCRVWTYNDFQHLVNSILALYDPRMSIEQDDDKESWEDTWWTKGERRRQLTTVIEMNRKDILHGLAHLQQPYGQDSDPTMQSKLYL